MELVGLGYTVWFTYRYLLFKVRQSASRPVLHHASLLFARHNSHLTRHYHLALMQSIFNLTRVVVRALCMVLSHSVSCTGNLESAIATRAMRDNCATAGVQSSREELLEDIEELKKKISGAVEES